MDNCINTSRKILELLKIKYTSKYLKDSILSHPDHPSLLAISDTFNRYNINNEAIKIGQDKFSYLPLPCIVQVSVRGTTFFYTLIKITDAKVIFYDQENKLKQETKEDLLKKWTGICLLAEKSEKSREIDIEKKLFERQTFNTLKGLIITLLLSWIIINFLNTETLLNTSLSAYIIIYSVLKLIGLTVGVFLLWFEIDQFNPTLQSFCRGGNKKINCNAILGSKHAKLFNGTLNLSLLSFSYFLGTLLFLLFYSFSPTTLFLLGVLSLISFPVVLISIYYQAIVIKQWCKFCVIIQALLIAEIGITFFGKFYKAPVEYEVLPLLLAVLLIPILGWKIVKPFLEQEKEANIYKRGLKKIKNNPDVLNGLLRKSRMIKTSTKGLGISIHKNSAKYHIVKVCNPYCGPCAKAHPVLEGLVNAGKIHLQILFTAMSSEDRLGKPVSHFLAIDEQGDKTKTQQALDDWYHAEQKDYIVFANKYPMNGELKKQNSKIEAMRTWCDAENITHTPTIFINDYELPKEYSIEDLTEVLQ